MYTFKARTLFDEAVPRITLSLNIFRGDDRRNNKCFHYKNFLSLEGKKDPGGRLPVVEDLIRKGERFSCEWKHEIK